MKKDNLFPSADRLELMYNGVEQLRNWLRDLMRIGLVNYDFSQSSLHEIASRMVDAKLGGIARRIRLLEELDRADASWSEMVSRELSQLYLFSTSFAKLQDLSWPMQQTILSVAGFNIHKENLPDDPSIDDHWLLLGQHQYQEEQLTVRRSWITGKHHRRNALLLDFTWGRRNFETKWSFTKAYTGRLLYYPGSFPLRAHLVKVKPCKRPEFAMPAFQSIDKFLDQYAKAIAANPWLRYFPAAFRNVFVHRGEAGFEVLDQYGGSLPVRVGDEAKNWSLLAIGGGEAITLFGEWNGWQIRLLSYEDSFQIHPLV